MSVFFRPFVGNLTKNFLNPSIVKNVASQGSTAFRPLEATASDIFQAAKSASPPLEKSKTRQIVENAIKTNKDPLTTLLRAKGYLSPHPKMPNEMLWPSQMPGEELIRVRTRAQQLIDKIKSAMPRQMSEAKTHLKTGQIIQNAFKNNENPVSTLLFQKGYLRPNTMQGGYHWPSSMPLLERIRAQEKAKKLVESHKPTPSIPSSTTQVGLFGNADRVKRFTEAMKDVTKVLDPLVEATKPRFKA